MNYQEERHAEKLLSEGWLSNDQANQLRKQCEIARGILTTAAVDVIAERRGQIAREGYDTTHDDEHTDRSIAMAATCYVRHYVQRAWVLDVPPLTGSNYQDMEEPPDWPDAWHGWKPKTPRQDLIRAAALIVAEIERLDRLEEKLLLSGAWKCSKCGFVGFWSGVHCGPGAG